MPLIWRTVFFSYFILFQGDLERIWVSTVLHFLSHYEDVFDINWHRRKGVETISMTFCLTYVAIIPEGMGRGSFGYLLFWAIYLTMGLGS